MHLETQFKNWLLQVELTLNKDRIGRKVGERSPHLRFGSECGIESLAEFEALLAKHKLNPVHCDDFTGSPDFKGQGFNLRWDNKTIGVLLAVQKPGRTKRKKFSPKNLGLAGYKADNVKIFKDKIIEGLVLVENDVGFRNCLISMLDNIEIKTPIEYHANLKINTNRISSDFGEILAAFESCCLGNVIEFPVKSNNQIADYIENTKLVSAKGRAAGNKLNLSEYADLIPKDNIIGQFLHSLASHNKNNFFKFGAELCSEAKFLADLVGGTEENNVVTYVKSNSYDTFYNIIKNDTRFESLGIPLPSKDSRPRALWAQGDANPFYFTLNTIINRLWGQVHTKEITEVVNQFLTELKFIHVDFDNEQTHIVTKEIKSDQITHWQTEYHSRATKAWHNWMAIQGTSK